MWKNLLYEYLDVLAYFVFGGLVIGVFEFLYRSLELFI